MYTKPGIYELTDSCDFFRSAPDDNSNYFDMVNKNNLVLILERLREYKAAYKDIHYWFKAIFNGKLGYFVTRESYLKPIT